MRRQTPLLKNSALVWLRPLIEGSGTIYGMFVIESLSQTKAEFFSSGVCRRMRS
jgi:phage protein U